MNWYPRFPGDYMRDTAHLSLVEHGVYNVLLDHYYSTGQPLPQPLSDLVRLCRAFEESERAAVQSIADKYFPVGDDGLRHNKRADRQLVEMDKKRTALSEAGKRGMAKRWKQPPNNQVSNQVIKQDIKEADKLAITKPHPHPHPHTTSHNPQPKRFAKPTVQEVKEYAASINETIDANKFWDYHESKGWLVGKTPMKDWQAAVRTWIRNQKTWDQPKQQAPANRINEYVPGRDSL